MNKNAILDVLKYQVEPRRWISHFGMEKEQLSIMMLT